MTTIRALVPADFDEWVVLWHGYLEFYESELSDETTQTTFGALCASDGMHGAIARDENDRAIGFVNWIPHPATWNPAGYVYLEDLFVAADVRGGGVGRGLINHVVEFAKAQGAAKVYWLTQTTNATGRRLYDKVATDTGFMHYEIELA